jgi:hypothetical protein
MTTNTNGPTVDYTPISAEDAPIGVQLWLTTHPDYAPNFTLEKVSVIRTETRTYVEWTYQSGTTRTFDVGEQVSCQLVDDTENDSECRSGHSHTDKEAARTCDVVHIELPGRST